MVLTLVLTAPAAAIATAEGAGQLGGEHCMAAAAIEAAASCCGDPLPADCEDAGCDCVAASLAMPGRNHALLATPGREPPGTGPLHRHPAPTLPHLIRPPIG